MWNGVADMDDGIVVIVGVVIGCDNDGAGGSVCGGVCMGNVGCSGVGDAGVGCGVCVDVVIRYIVGVDVVGCVADVVDCTCVECCICDVCMGVGAGVCGAGIDVAMVGANNAGVVGVDVVCGGADTGVVVVRSVGGDVVDVDMYVCDATCCCDGRLCWCMRLRCVLVPVVLILMLAVTCVVSVFSLM